MTCHLPAGILAYVEKPPHTSRRPRDLVISLIVLLVPVVLLFGGYQLLAGRNQPVAVDPTGALAEARSAGLTATTPTGLGEDWVPVSAVFQRVDGGLTLRIGYVTPDRASVQLVQSTVPADRLLPAELPEAAAPAGELDVAGQPWQRYESESDGRSLVLMEPELTTVVVGDAAEAELQQLAASVG
jgi:uncharacterized protein DUF4245